MQTDGSCREKRGGAAWGQTGASTETRQLSDLRGLKKKKKDLPYNKWKLHQNGMLLFSFWLLDIVLRLTVKTDGQSSQTVLVLAAFEKRKH